jgi:hypothetical protein
MVQDVTYRASWGNKLLAHKEQELRSHLDWLRARYDGGAVTASIHVTIKTLETDLSWLQHRGRS